MSQVEGKVAIVTGGASGIGAACATTLAREGAKVVVTDLDDSEGQSVVDKIRAGGGSIHYYVVHRRPPRVGRVSGLLRDEGRRAPVREGSRDGMRGGRRRYPDQHGSSRRHRHADLDEDTSIHWQQHAD